MTERLTVPEALRRLFGIDVARESPLLKNKAMSLVRNGLIRVEKVQVVQRAATYLAEGQLTVLHNAMLLNAVFDDPKQVKRLFEETKVRAECAQTLRTLFCGRNTLLGLGLSHSRAGALVEAIEGDFDLYRDRLPDPFEVLPQVALGGNLSLLQALLAQSASLAPGDSMLLDYLKGDLQAAAAKAEMLAVDEPALAALRQHILDAYREAREFDDLLDLFRPC